MIDLKRNYFELFDLSPTLTVDVQVLSEQYREFQKRYHPDQAALASDAEKRQAVQVSTFINTAFETLKSPLSRATYLLRLNGVDVDTETDTRMDMDFLMLQMQWREQLEQLPDNDDAWDELDALTEDVKKHRQNRLSACEHNAKQNDWAALRDDVRKLQFIEKMLKELNEKAERLEDEA